VGSGGSLLEDDGSLRTLVFVVQTPSLVVNSDVEYEGSGGAPDVSAKDAVADDIASLDLPVDQPIMIARLMDDLRHDPVLPPPAEDMQVALTLWGNRRLRRVITFDGNVSRFKS